MAEIRFGHREGPGKGKEYPVAASQTFYRRGGKFVYLDSAGAVTLVNPTNATQIFGWAEIPKDAAGQAYWTSNSTAKVDKVFVITPTPGDVFELPCADTSLSATSVGVAAAAVVIRSSIQKADIDNSASTNMLTVVGFDNDNDTVLVRVISKFLQTKVPY